MDKPTRNRNAEQTLSLRIIDCDIAGCSRSIVFSKLRDHKQNECEHIPSQCKFKDIGCEWKGIKRDIDDHEKNCTLDQNKILELFHKMKEHQKILIQEKAENKTIRKLNHESDIVMEHTIIVSLFDDKLELDPSKIKSKLSWTKNGVDVSVKFTMKFKFDKNEHGNYVFYSKLMSSENIEQIGIIAFDADGRTNLVSKSQPPSRGEWREFDNILRHEDRDRFLDGIYINVFVEHR